MSSTFNLTFGVEIEFLMAYFPDPESLEISARKAKGDWRVEDTYHLEVEQKWAQRAKVRAALIAAGLEVNSYHRTKLGYGKWTVIGDGSVKPRDSDLVNASPSWAKGHFNDFTPEELSAIRFVDCEVISPILDWNTTQPDELFKAIDAITKLPVFCPPTSGLHVHLGNRNNGFPLETIKKFAMLVHCFEEQINQVHPDHRLDNNFCVLPKFAFRPCEQEDSLRMLAIINRLEYKYELKEFFGTERIDRRLPHHYRAYNFSNIQNPMKCTIELRQHKGTLDCSTIARWVSLAGELMLYAHKADLNHLVSFISTHSKKADFTILDLLRNLDLGFLADSYQDHLYDHTDVYVEDPWGNGEDYC